MSAKTANIFVSALLALVMTFNAITVLVPATKLAEKPAAMLAMEHGTTGS